MSGVGEPFECAVCHGEFRKGRSDGEAVREQAELWRPLPGDTESDVVCEGCFREVMAWARTQHPEFLR